MKLTKSDIIGWAENSHIAPKHHDALVALFKDAGFYNNDPAWQKKRAAVLRKVKDRDAFEWLHREMVWRRDRLAMREKTVREICKSVPQKLRNTCIHVLSTICLDGWQGPDLENFYRVKIKIGKRFDDVYSTLCGAFQDYVEPWPDLT